MQLVLRESCRVYYAMFDYTVKYSHSVFVPEYISCIFVYTSKFYCAGHTTVVIYY